jgi:hypothetical protein
VGGVIDLQERNITIAHPFVTIAGQTAPSPGITLIRGGLSISTHDVIMQHIRVRPGDAGREKKSGWSPDGITTNAAYNVLFDHCSATWAVDENLSVSGPRLLGPEATSHDVTIRHCLIAEGLDDSSHEKGPHSKGTLIHDYCRNIAIIGNVYAHNVDRNPYFKAFTTGVIVNNLIYNPRSKAINVNYAPSEWENTDIEPQNCQITVVGNVMIHGVDTKENLAMVSPRGDVFLQNNLAKKRNGEPAPLIGGTIRLLREKPAWPQGLMPLHARDVEAFVLQNAGARPKDRDAIDFRIMQQIRDREGRIIDSQDEVGGYPAMPMTQRVLTIPESNMDKWLADMARELEYANSFHSATEME